MLGARHHPFHSVYHSASLVKIEETNDSRHLQHCRACPVKSLKNKSSRGFAFLSTVSTCSRNLYFTSCKMRFVTDDSATTQGRRYTFFFFQYTNRSWLKKDQSCYFATLLKCYIRPSIKNARP